MEKYLILIIIYLFVISYQIGNIKGFMKANENTEKALSGWDRTLDTLKKQEDINKELFKLNSNGLNSISNKKKK